ncbi:MAG: UDP-N-acetylglucosamine 1-carboxyvinyltransferase [Candidatus Kerfeldbacteria bacterium]
MDTFVINGGTQLKGELRVNGAKNHALKLIPAAFLTAEETIIQNVPNIEDVARMLEIVEKIGGTVKHQDEHTVALTPPREFDGRLPEDLVPTLRASIVLLGPVLARYDAVRLPLPGGDNIGKRPINFFLDGFEALGATVKEEKETYVFTAPNGLQGATIVFPRITVTGTETLMMAATLATGTTILRNAACEPEIEALAEYLNSVGADISGGGTHTITINGTDRISGGTATVIPDRIEAGSFVLMAAATRSKLTITNCDPTHLEIPLALLNEMGIQTETTAESIAITNIADTIQPLDLVTHEYPGFPTDLQAPMAVLLTQATGESNVRETIYDGRLLYVDMLNSMGTNIKMIDPYRATITGPTPLHGMNVASPDIRAGIAMVIAGLLAEGTTTIDHIYQIDRGYETIEKRLQSVGAQIKRVGQEYV